MLRFLTFFLIIPLAFCRTHFAQAEERGHIEKIPTAAPPHGSGWSALSMSADGRSVVFTAPKRNLIPQSKDKWYRAFIFDTHVKKTLLIPFEPKGNITEAHISSDGSKLLMLVDFPETSKQVLYVSDSHGNNLKKIDEGVLYNTQLSGNGRFVTYSFMASNSPSTGGGYDLLKNKPFSLNLKIDGKYIQCRNRYVNRNGVVACLNRLKGIQGKSHYEVVAFDMAKELKLLYRLDYVKFFKWNNHGLHYPFIDLRFSIGTDANHVLLLIDRRPNIGYPKGEKSIQQFHLKEGKFERSVLLKAPVESGKGNFWKLRFSSNADLSTLAYEDMDDQSKARSLNLLDIRTGKTHKIWSAPKERIGIEGNVAISEDGNTVAFYSDYDPDKPIGANYNLFVYYK